MRCYRYDYLMNRTIPSIHESADDLKQLLSRERHPAKHQRLHALYLLASGQARFRGDVARLRGLDRNTVGRWLDQYAAGGRAALLTIYVPAGKRKPLSADQLAHLRHRLADPQGFASYDQVRQWIQASFGVTRTYNATQKLVRYTLGAKLKVARPSHIKKP
jgi:transposase